MDVRELESATIRLKLHAWWLPEETLVRFYTSVGEERHSPNFRYLGTKIRGFTWPGHGREVILSFSEFLNDPYVCLNMIPVYEEETQQNDTYLPVVTEVSRVWNAGSRTTSIAHQVSSINQEGGPGRLIRAHYRAYGPLNNEIIELYTPSGASLTLEGALKELTYAGFTRPDCKESLLTFEEFLDDPVLSLGLVPFIQDHGMNFYLSYGEMFQVAKVRNELERTIIETHTEHGV